jgi:hypothetical protein
LSIETVKEANTPKPPSNPQHISIYLVPFAELSREINSVNLVKFGFGTHDYLWGKYINRLTTLMRDAK